MKNKIIFGTDGWRGLLDRDINEETVSIAAQAFADYLRRKSGNSVSISYDGRERSGIFARIFATVMSGNKIKAFLSNQITPTPALSFSVPALGASAGVMITASHNPYEYNGVKFKSSLGGPFTTEQTSAVEKYLYTSRIATSEDGIEEINIMDIYLSRLKTKIDLELLKTSGVYPLIDSMGGAGRRFITDFLSGFGIGSETIYGIPSPSFYGRNAEPIEKNLEPLRLRLREKQYSFGAATDGDADRLGIMDDTGAYVSAQEVILILADYLVNSKKTEGPIVKTSSVTDKITYYFKGTDREVFDVQVGFKFVSETMIEKDAAFGCEESGGFGYKGHIPERDGILSLLLIMEMLAASGYQKLSDYISIKREQFGPVFYDRIDHKFDSGGEIKSLAEINFEMGSYFHGFKVTGTDRFLNSRGIVNGIKIRFEGISRWLLIRVSETEPIVRIYSEGDSDEEVKILLQQGLKIIHKEYEQQNS